MKKIFIVLMFASFVFIGNANAGFLGGVLSSATANMITSSGSSSKSYSSPQLKYMNRVLWNHVKEKKKDNSVELDGYEFYIDALKSSSTLGYVDTAAQAYYVYGLKDEAIKLYENRIMDVARGYPNDGYIETYMEFKGLESKDEINYSEIYKRVEKERKKEASKGIDVNIPVSVILLLLLICMLLLLNVLVLVLGLPKERLDYIKAMISKIRNKK